MKKSFTKIYIHYVWATKRRAKVLSKSIVAKINNHIREYALENKIFTFAVNGYLDHYHFLVDIPPTISVSEAINKIKGESSHWINSSELLPGKFAWQERYSAFSVSASQKIKVERYICNQESHHQKLTYFEELKLFYNRYGIEFSEGPEEP